MKRRAGVTLTEVLVAVLVVGLALMALMTLFPLGAMNMVQAIKDDRTRLAADNAQANLRMIWRTSLQSGNTDATLETNLSKGPIYLDPIGAIGHPGNPSVGAIPRLNMPGFTLQKATRWFTLLDDMTFELNGTPRGAPTEPQRDKRYSWAYLIRKMLRPDGSPDPRALEFSVVVYSGRTMGLNAALSPIGENSFSATFNVQTSTVTLNYTGQAPKLRKGYWLLDATMVPEAPEPHGYFYRVVSLVDYPNASPAHMDVTVQSAFRGRFGTSNQGTVVVLDNVAEVFLMGTLE